MKTLSLHTILKVIDAQNTNISNCRIKYISNSSKKLRNRTVVFFLNKQDELNIKRFNRYQNCYIVTDQALLKGTIVDESKFIFVKNVEKAYQRFCEYYRNLFKRLVVAAVTGTCGKTTTKEMIAQVLRNKYQVVATIGNKNALRFDHDYLMSIDDKTDFGIFETAITHPHHLIDRCEFFKPAIGIITNIGIDHLNHCKTIDNYIRTKSEMLAGLDYNGTLIINNDDENIKKINLSTYQGKVITFGIKEKADFYATDLKYTKRGMAFILHYLKQCYQVWIPGFGEHNVYNALATLAALNVIGEDLNEAIDKIAKITHIKSHVEFHEGYNNSIIIDDTWSSNPTSMEAALKVLRDQGRNKIKIVVLGKINYLGEQEKLYYQEIAEMILKYQVDCIITIDDDSIIIGERAFELGMNPSRIIHCDTKEYLRYVLESLLDEDTMVLFKFSLLDKSHAVVIDSVIRK